MEQGLGFAHFIAQVDTVGKVVLLLLLLLSLTSWYLIVTKWLANWLEARRAKVFIEKFWQYDTVDALHGSVLQHKPDHAFSKLAFAGTTALRNADRHGVQKLAAAGGMSEFITRALRNGIDQETAHNEHGLTILATTGSASPYIGLFGTVWAIYHALVQIGVSGQGTLDKVAGPVGEALIMTALGLAVAIPAVFAYNAFNRRNRMWQAKLDAFAHDLFVLLTMGNAIAGKVNPAGESV